MIETKSELVSTVEAAEQPQESKSDQVGNDLFQQCVVAPYKAAAELVRATPRTLTGEQAKRKRKARSARKAKKKARRC